MWAAPLWAGKWDRRREAGRRAGEPRGQGAHSEGRGWAPWGVQERALGRRGPQEGAQEEGLVPHPH